jgi:hypothetical protein
LCLKRCRASTADGGDHSWPSGWAPRRSR